jgi:hypothetical protein
VGTANALDHLGNPPKEEDMEGAASKKGKRAIQVH